MTDTIFDDTATTTSVANSPIENLVGEGKKFKTIEDLANGKIQADTFIEQLKAENATLREEITARARLEDVVDRLTSQRTNEQYEDPNHGNLDNQRQPAITPSELDRLIDKTITRRETERTARQNREITKQELAKVFGSDYGAKLETRRLELGLDRSDMDAMAEKSPTAFMQLVQPKTQQAPPYVPPRSSASSEHIHAQTTPTGQPGTKSFYDAIKKADPDRYWKPEVQFQMHKDAIKAAKEGREF